MSQVARITVDNITYNVGVEYESMKRNATLFEGSNTGTAIAGNSIRDIIGTKYSYEMTIYALPGYQNDYDTLYYSLTAPVDYHHVELPFGQTVIEFDAMIETINDTYYGVQNGTNLWDKMTVEFAPIRPQRSA